MILFDAKRRLDVHLNVTGFRTSTPAKEGASPARLSFSLTNNTCSTDFLYIKPYKW